MSSNSLNPEKGVMYSYDINDIDTLYNKDYSNTGHGNGMIIPKQIKFSL